MYNNIITCYLAIENQYGDTKKISIDQFKRLILYEHLAFA